MKNTMYLQKDYNGTYALVVKNNYKDELFNTDYILVMGNISKDTTFETLNKLVVEKFGCQKLIIQF